jgi:hypothetical protein
VPWSAALLGLLGVSAVGGFPLDDLWHAAYGIDVTMWSPTHMLMICGAAFTGAASWLALREAGVPVRGRFWFRTLHVLAAWFTLQGLVAPLGEFAFGVPQFDQVFHPLLLGIAAGIALVAIRVVLGPGWALGIATVSFLLDATNALGGGGGLPAPPRAVGVYVGSALVVELVARVLGTARPLRFAVVSGIGIATVGMAVEWAWNTGAYQPWKVALVPEALLLGIPVAMAAAVLGLTLAGRRPARPVVLAATAVVLFGLAWPMHRPTGDVTAAVQIRPAGENRAAVTARLSPADAADGNRWFQVMSWQGGGLEATDLRETSPGRWVAEAPVAIGGNHKTVLRLHRGHQMMSVPIWLPADPEIGAAVIPAVDRTMAFQPETDYLLRETKPGAQWFAWVVYALLALVTTAWITGFGLVTARVSGQDARVGWRRRGFDREAPERLIAASSVPR